jgi:cytidine deaminase
MKRHRVIDMDKNELVRLALEARENSYSPYSHFRVGAALLSADGRVFTGCNVENAAYSPTICAERTAVVKAVSEGIKDFTAIAIVGGEGEIKDFCTPCGVCRQVLREFCDPDTFTVVLARSPEETKELTLGELLPFGFGKETLVN